MTPVARLRAELAALDAPDLPPHLKLCRPCNMKQIADPGRAAVDGVEVCEPCAELIDAWPARWARWEKAEQLRAQIRRINQRKKARQRS